MPLAGATESLVAGSGGGRSGSLFPEFVEPGESISAVEDDPDGGEFLEAAVAGGANYVVSGHGHLLALESFRGIDIVDPRTSYEHLQGE